MERAYKQPDRNALRKQGHTRIHRDLSGEVIGGIDADGNRYGTRAGGGGMRTGMSSRPLKRAEGQPAQQAQPRTTTSQSQARLQPGGTRAATGNLLNQRILLFKEMEKVGYENITPEMREKARSLGVQDQDFNRAVSRIKENSAYSGATPTNSAPQTQNPPRSYKQPPRNTVLGSMSDSSKAPRTKWEQARSDRSKAQDAQREKGLNPLTGLPLNSSYKDAKPVAPVNDELKEQRRQENNKRILAEHYARTGQPDPRAATKAKQSPIPAAAIAKDPITPPPAQQPGKQPAVLTRDIAKPTQPTTAVTKTPSPPLADLGMAGNNDFAGGAPSWRKPPISLSGATAKTGPYMHKPRRW